MNNKFLSRKFIISICGAIIGACSAFSGFGGKVGFIMGIISAVVSLVAYIITEGINDHAGIIAKGKETINNINQLIEEADIKEVDETVEMIKRAIEDEITVEQATELIKKIQEVAAIVNGGENNGI